MTSQFRLHYQATAYGNSFSEVMAAPRDAKLWRCKVIDYSLD